MPDGLLNAPVRQSRWKNVHPHVIEHGGKLWIAFSRNKLKTGILAIDLDDIDGL